MSSLYAKVLVEEPAGQKGKTLTAPSAAAQSEPIRSLGLHQRSILILVNESNAPFLSDEAMTYLTKILNACKLTMNDVALVNLANHPGAGYQQLQERFPSQKLIGFGITPETIGLPIDFPAYQLQNLSGCTYVIAPALSELENAETEKRKLWATLKKLFNV